MVQFKESKNWSSDKKKLLMERAVTTLNSFNIRDTFELLSPDFDNMRACSLQAEYYTLLEKESETVVELLQDLRKQGVEFKDPYRISNSRKHFPIVKAVVKAPEVKTISEGDILNSIGRLVEGLTKLDGPDTTAFINGLTAIVNKAMVPDMTQVIIEKDARIAELETRISRMESEYNKVSKGNELLAHDNEEMIEKIKSIDFILEEYMKLSISDKVMNIGKVTNELKLTVDKYGNVMKAERV